MMQARWAILSACIFAGLALSGSAQNASTHSPSAKTDLRIQSPILRIEFDRKLHSRVVALLGKSPELLTPFSASETLSGSGRNWSDFALTSSRQDTVHDNFGSGDRLSLTGKSGDLRKTVSVTMYVDFPSLAIFDVEY